MKAKKYLRIPTFTIPLWWPDLPGNWRAWLPSRGNVLFTLLVVGGLLWAASAGALPLRAPAAAGTSTGTIAYQGRLADANGSPLTGTYNMIFRLYEAASSGAPLWTEQWTGSNGVKVSDGLFNVMLGSLTPIPTSLVTDHASLFLGITVGTDDEMTPRVQLGSVPFAVQALTVPDGSVTTAKLADGAVTSAKLNVDNGLGMNGNLTVTGNVTLAAGEKQILFSDPGNCDFSIIHNGGISLDFRSPECHGITAMRLFNNGDVAVNGAIQSSINVMLRYATVTTDSSGEAHLDGYHAVLKPAHWWNAAGNYWATDYDFDYDSNVWLLRGLPPNAKVVVYYIAQPGGPGNPASSPPNW